ncbi:MAG: C-GCAxxG-C-C family protein [Deferribacterota bacterium]|nr:C-GCAxxG-C-C family protein [Deferribacterota bacterium]
MGEEKKCSRRNFLAASAVGVGSVLSVGSLFAGFGPFKEVKQAGSVKQLPWSIGSYRFDINEVGERAYNNFYKYECMGGVVCTLLEILSENIGYPFNTLPLDMFRFGGGGVAGWGTICGTLNGSAQIFNLVGAPSNYTLLINDVIDWYQNQEFPSTHHDSYAKFKNQARTVAKSPICHVSVTLWVNGAREVDDPSISSLSPERADRCAKVTGDVAMHVAEMLNQYYDGRYHSQFDPAKVEYASCLNCHLDTQNAYNPNVKAQMECSRCHVDLKQIDPSSHPFGM